MESRYNIGDVLIIKTKHFDLANILILIEIVQLSKTGVYVRGYNNSDFPFNHMEFAELEYYAPNNLGKLESEKDLEMVNILYG